MDETHLTDDPMKQFGEWLVESEETSIYEPNAFVLSMVNKNNTPSSRTLLLKGNDDEGFVFFTNFGPREGEAIGSNPHVSAVFGWYAMYRQVLIEGTVQKTSDKESETYFHSRPHESQVAAWSSKQSAPIDNRTKLDQQLDHAMNRFEYQEVSKLADLVGEHLCYCQRGRSRLMGSKIDVSLVILNYNCGPFLDRVIRSCLNQRAENLGIEIIVVDDGSTDNSVNVIQKYEKIQLIRIPANRGVGYASATALDNVRGRYFMRVDADDHISEDSCRLLTEALERHDQYGFAHGDIRKIFDESGERETIALDNSETLYEHGAGVLFRTSIVRQVGGYNPQLRNCEDLDLFLRLEKKGVEGLRIPQTLYRYHIHSGNTSLDSSRDNIRAELYSWYS